LVNRHSYKHLLTTTQIILSKNKYHQEVKQVGQCVFCGEPAGFLRSKHKECKEKDDLIKEEIWAKEKLKQKECEASKNIIISEIESAGIKETDLPLLEKKISTLAEQFQIDEIAIKKLVIKGWEKSVDKAFEDGILTQQEEASLVKLMEYFSLNQVDLDENGAYTKTLKGLVLRDLFEGIITDRMDTTFNAANLPFNLQKSEQIIWVFSNVAYFEQKKRTQYVGGSQGVSMRIAKGLYYRTGAFKGERVETHETIHADTGLLGVTNKHLYFTGEFKNFRIKYDKIVSFEPFSDGIGLQRDAATAKSQSFETGDGWFTYNLITNAAQL